MINMIEYFHHEILVSFVDNFSVVLNIFTWMRQDVAKIVTEVFWELIKSIYLGCGLVSDFFLKGFWTFHKILKIDFCFQMLSCFVDSAICKKIFLSLKGIHNFLMFFNHIVFGNSIERWTESKALDFMETSVTLPLWHFKVSSNLNSIYLVTPPDFHRN